MSALPADLAPDRKLMLEFPAGALPSHVRDRHSLWGVNHLQAHVIRCLLLETQSEAEHRHWLDGSGRPDHPWSYQRSRQVKVVKPEEATWCRIQPWNDALYDKAQFRVPALCRLQGMASDAIRKRLLSLVEIGQVELVGKASYRLPRARCDELAFEAGVFWILCGYSDSEYRRRDMAREENLFWDGLGVTEGLERPQDSESACGRQP